MYNPTYCANQIETHKTERIEFQKFRVTTRPGLTKYCQKNQAKEKDININKYNNKG